MLMKRYKQLMNLLIFIKPLVCWGQEFADKELFKEQHAFYAQNKFLWVSRMQKMFL